MLAVSFCSCGNASSSNNNFVFSLNDNGNSYSIRASSTDISGKITIPFEYKGKPVTCICDYAFEGCEKIQKIIVPNSVTSIGKYAFSNCSELIYLSIPNSVISIGNEIIINCSKLENINYNSTITQWNGILKGLYGIGKECLVVCTNGNITAHTYGGAELQERTNNQLVDLAEQVDKIDKD